MSRAYKLAQRVAGEAAELLRRDYLKDAQITDECDKDIKTQADVVAQALILSHLEPTGIPVLAEEGNVKELDLAHPVWLVDPLDGTLNFTRGFSMAAVSIALWDKGQPVFGVVQDIFYDVAYTGVVGKGAWCSDQSMCVSSIDAVGEAILATGFPSGRRYDTESLLGFVHAIQSYKKIRMLGSAALMLARVAAGHFDVYEEEDIYIWDVAAGLALVRASGGRFTMVPGSGPFKYHVKATNGRL